MFRYEHLNMTKKRYRHPEGRANPKDLVFEFLKFIKRQVSLPDFKSSKSKLNPNNCAPAKGGRTTRPRQKDRKHSL